MSFILNKPSFNNDKIAKKSQESLSEISNNTDNAASTLDIYLTAIHTLLKKELPKSIENSKDSTDKLIKSLDSIFQELSRDIKGDVKVTNLSELTNQLDKIVNLLLEQKPPVVNVPEPVLESVVNVKASMVNVRAGDVTIPAPVVNVPAPVVNVPAPVVNVPAPVVNVPSPVVNVPAPVVNVPKTDFIPIIRELSILLNKIRDNDVANPLAVRLSDGNEWIEELKTLGSRLVETGDKIEKSTDKGMAVWTTGSRKMFLKNLSGEVINPATDEGTGIPSGTGTNGTVDLTSADTWYAVPSTIPTDDYVLVVSLENAVGTIRWGYDNTGTPGATNGLQAPNILTLRLKGDQSIYYASSTAGDDVNWTTKVI